MPNNELRDYQIPIGNEYMYVDVDAFMAEIHFPTDDKTINVEKDKDVEGNYSINLPKFEFFKLMLDVCLGYAEEVDDTLGKLGLNKTTIPFRLAINTLIEYKILKKCK